MALRHFDYGRTATGDDAYRATWRARPAAGRHRARGITRTAIVARSASPILRAKSNARRISEELVGSSTGASVAGFIAEPIQGVGGFITPPQEYFQIIKRIVRTHGGVFISDEVETGWGRRGGNWFGISMEWCLTS